MSVGGNPKLRVIAAAILAVSVLAPENAQGGHALKPQEQVALAGWLAHHKHYRMATDADCGCDDDIKRMRAGDGRVWRPLPDYQPYSATGDFNGDGVSDFAVVLVERTRASDKFTLVVFNGASKRRGWLPSYVEDGLDLEGKGLFYGPPRPRPYRLVVGPFESDNSCILIPQGSTYHLDCN
jgi:hypothetical protein